MVGIASCGTPNEGAFEFDLSTVYNQINFEKPEVGQISTYIYFNGSNFGLSSSSISYTGDTLQVSLIAKSGNNYTFQERITNASAVYDASIPYIESHDILKTSEWQLLGDSFSLIGGSTFLYWDSTTKVPLNVGDDMTQVSLRNWGNNTTELSPYFSVLTGRINDFNFDDLTISYLNLTPNLIHADYFELIANRPFGIVRSSTFNSDLLSGSGWDLQLGS